MHVSSTVAATKAADKENEAEILYQLLSTLVKAADNELPSLPHCPEFSDALYQARRHILN